MRGVSVAIAATRTGRRLLTTLPPFELERFFAEHGMRPLPRFLAMTALTWEALCRARSASPAMLLGRGATNHVGPALPMRRRGKHQRPHVLCRRRTPEQCSGAGLMDAAKPRIHDASRPPKASRADSLVV